MKLKLLILLTSFLYLEANTILFIKDKSDFITYIKNPIIYYSSKKGSSISLFYKPDTQSDGIRIQEGLGKTVIPWKKIKHIDFKNLDDEIILNIELIEQKLSISKKDKKTGLQERELELKAINDVDGIQGDTELGIYAINFNSIKSIDVITENHLGGIFLAIDRYKDIPLRFDIPKELELDNDKKIIEFVQKKLTYGERNLTIKRFGQYIIVHYEKEGKDWEVKKFGNSLVIDKSTMKYFYFELSKS